MTMEQVDTSALRDDINARFVEATNFLLAHHIAHNKNEVMTKLGLYLGRLSLILAGKANASTDNIACLCRSYGVSAEWILLGTGQMLPGTAFVSERSAQSHNAAPGSLPLIPIAALAGFNGIDEEGINLDECTRYIVPEFYEAGADFLIRIQGNSMSPTYMSSDMVACKKLEAGAWIEFGDAYVIDSAQGVMIKRIFNDPNDAEKFLCRSDNPDVAPFSIAKNEVRSLSKVIGIIRNA